MKKIKITIFKWIPQRTGNNAPVWKRLDDEVFELDKPVNIKLQEWISLFLKDFVCVNSKLKGYRFHKGGAQIKGTLFAGPMYKYLFKKAKNLIKIEIRVIG